MYAAAAHTRAHLPELMAILGGEPVSPDAPTEVPAPPREKPKPKPKPATRADAGPGRLVAVSEMPPTPGNGTLTEAERNHAWRAHLQAMLSDE